MLIGAILLGLALVALTGLMLLRASRPPKAGGIREVDPQTVEQEVYEKLYGKRSRGVSRARPVEPSGEAGADTGHVRSSPALDDGLPTSDDEIVARTDAVREAAASGRSG